MLIKARVTETYPLFAKILNIEDSRQVDLGIGVNLPIASLVPLIMKMLAEETNHHTEQAEGILNWITDAILYIKGDLDLLPTIDFGYNISFDTETAEEQRRKEILDKRK